MRRRSSSCPARSGCPTSEGGVQAAAQPGSSKAGAHHDFSCCQPICRASTLCAQAIWLTAAARRMQASCCRRCRRPAAATWQLAVPTHSCRLRRQPPNSMGRLTCDWKAQASLHRRLRSVLMHVPSAELQRAACRAACMLDARACGHAITSSVPPLQPSAMHIPTAAPASAWLCRQQQAARPHKRSDPMALHRGSYSTPTRSGGGRNVLLHESRENHANIGRRGHAPIKRWRQLFSRLKKQSSIHN